jgi:ComF family protein
MLQLLADFVNLVYPKVCFLCNRPLVRTEEHVCLSCQLDWPVLLDDPKNPSLLQKFSFQPKVTGAWAYLEYIKGGMAQRMVHAIKYKQRDDLAVWLGETMGEKWVGIEAPLPDIIVPLPLHQSRQKHRGYNQSERIASGFGQILHVPVCSDLVKRVRKTETQTKKSKVGRWQNIEDVFEIARPEEIKGKSVMVLDDVVTTGATLGMLCDLIADYEPREILVAALATPR